MKRIRNLQAFVKRGGHRSGTDESGQRSSATPASEPTQLIESRPSKSQTRKITATALQHTARHSMESSEFLQIVTKDRSEAEIITNDTDDDSLSLSSLKGDNDSRHKDQHVDSWEAEPVMPAHLEDSNVLLLLDGEEEGSLDFSKEFLSCSGGRNGYYSAPIGGNFSSSSGASGYNMSSPGLGSRDSWAGRFPRRNDWMNRGGRRLDIEDDDDHDAERCYLAASPMRSVSSVSSGPSSRASTRASRCAITESSIQGLDFYNEYQDLVKAQRLKDWATQFRRTDPRFQILRFFNDVAQGGADKIEQTGINPDLISPLLSAFYRSSVFTVWRPTSTESIKKMMLGEAVGKGLDIKGKSAKHGKLSGFVPFLQIHKEKHKKLIRTLPKDGRLRIFYQTVEYRDEAVRALKVVLEEMMEVATEAKIVVADKDVDDETYEKALEKLLWDMENPEITQIDDYAPKCYGIEVAERLFWEGYVMRQSCERVRGSEYDTGRPSEPAFQDMNFMALRRKDETSGRPRPVIWQYADASDPMCAMNLLMAYEEHGRVLPVVSDFDCFLVGTRGVTYDAPMEPEQVEMVKWCISQIEAILDSPLSRDTWTSRWLEVLKHKASSKALHPEMPEFGYGDPKSYSIVKHAIKRLERDGCVRHGAECFNYYFPQELDNKFLVISDAVPGKLQWKYMNVMQLQDFLCKRIDDGFTFPLHPKWILCDFRWKHVYDRLMASDKSNVQDSLNIWYPPESGIREKIEEIHQRHPRGFSVCSKCPVLTTSQRFRKISENTSWAEEYDGTSKMDLAELELKKHLTLQRAKTKLRTIILMNRMLRKTRMARLTKEMKEAAPPPSDGSPQKGEGRSVEE